MEKTFQSEKPEDLRLIQARYKLLQQTIIDEQEKEEQKEKKNNIPLLNQKQSMDQDSSASCESVLQQMSYKAIHW